MEETLEVIKAEVEECGEHGKGHVRNSKRLVWEIGY
jgi:hypothetical protein